MSTKVDQCLFQKPFPRAAELFGIFAIGVGLERFVEFCAKRDASEKFTDGRSHLVVGGAQLGSAGDGFQMPDNRARYLKPLGRLFQTVGRVVVAAVFAFVLDRNQGRAGPLDQFGDRWLYVRSLDAIEGLSKFCTEKGVLIERRHGELSLARPAPEGIRAILTEFEAPCGAPDL